MKALIILIFLFVQCATMAQIQTAQTDSTQNMNSDETKSVNETRLRDQSNINNFENSKRAYTVGEIEDLMTLPQQIKDLKNEIENCTDEKQLQLLQKKLFFLEEKLKTFHGIPNTTDDE